MKRRPILALALMSGLACSACYRGYKSAGDLESDDRGPKDCANACQALGLTMSAFVLVEHTQSACVCAPAHAGRALEDAAAAAAAGKLLIDEEQRQADAARRWSGTPPPP